jgi:CBS domain-containing protein
MPATIAELLRGKPEPVSASLDDKVQDILATMVKHDYSQLPIVDAANKPIGLITCDSIIRALHNFGVTTEALSVKDAMLKRPPTYYPGDDVFDLLDDLETSQVVFVIDADSRLIGLLTPFDTTAYLRQRAQDIMVVQEIEEMVKSYTQAAFTNSSGEIDEEKQKTAITEITPSNNSVKGKFRRALVHYLQQCGDANPQINTSALDAAFEAQLYEKPWIKPFEKLTLGEYINLFLRPGSWSVYSSVFTLDSKAIRRLLERVRGTRNMLAHFRDDITSAQREELRFCKEWLARHETAINVAFGLGKEATSPSDQTNHPTETPTNTAANDGHGSSPEIPGPTNEQYGQQDAPSDEPGAELDSRYAPLIQYLSKQPVEIERVTLSFKEIDTMLGEHRLPDSARKYRAWWANDSGGHSHSQQWLDAGWRAGNLNMSEERVTFVRNKEQEQAYIEFFSLLRAELERAAPGIFHFAPSEGRYWLEIGRVYADNKYVATFYCSFTKTKRFRVEAYIDTGDAERTKRIYDALYDRKERIEAEVGESLSWERMSDHRPSRIARYYPGTIKESSGTLANLRARVVEASQRFYPVLERHLNEVVASVMQRNEQEPIGASAA